ncbi:hypothetical protein N7510_007394 [Penicillium lagena]|uniref:uncharacterized protein n=1 Tax=Penicillium lagena TaxID=94218 RepID=UPI00253F9D0E|nr:uncharacterized protein N7510_007394 [Penicillium lagena]KAJ5610675.1 hypothetical protein N7510_007394 [Penicillium lagena]
MPSCQRSQGRICVFPRPSIKHNHDRCPCQALPHLGNSRRTAIPEICETACGGCPHDARGADSANNGRPSAGAKTLSNAFFSVAVDGGVSGKAASGSEGLR